MTPDFPTKSLARRKRRVFFLYPDFVCGGCRGRLTTTQKGAKYGQQKHESWRSNKDVARKRTIPTRNSTKRQNQAIRKQHNNSWCIAPESLRISPLNFHTHFSSIFALKKVGGVSLSSGIVAVAVSPSEKSLSETVAEEIGWSAGFLNASSVAAP